MSDNNNLPTVSPISAQIDFRLSKKELIDMLMDQTLSDLVDRIGEIYDELTAELTSFAEEKLAEYEAFRQKLITGLPPEDHKRIKAFSRAAVKFYGAASHKVGIDERGSLELSLYKDDDVLLRSLPLSIHVGVVSSVPRTVAGLAKSAIYLIREDLKPTMDDLASLAEKDAYHRRCGAYRMPFSNTWFDPEHDGGTGAHVNWLPDRAFELYCELEEIKVRVHELLGGSRKLRLDALKSLLASSEQGKSVLELLDSVRNKQQLAKKLTANTKE